MKSMNFKAKVRTVTIGKRGQLVIPEDIRSDIGIDSGTTMVLLESDGDIILRKEDAVLRTIEGEDAFWDKLAKVSLEKAWGKEDEIWDKLAKTEHKKHLT